VFMQIIVADWSLLATVDLQDKYVIWFRAESEEYEFQKRFLEMVGGT
jgi:hypothetical protein